MTLTEAKRDKTLIKTVREVILGEHEPEPAPPEPERKKAPLSGKVTTMIRDKMESVKDTMAYNKKKRKTKKMFDGIGDGSQTDLGILHPVDEYSTLPPAPIKSTQKRDTYHHYDIDYWKSLNRDTRKVKTFSGKSSRSSSSTSSSSSDGNTGVCHPNGPQPRGSSGWGYVDTRYGKDDKCYSTTGNRYYTNKRKKFSPSPVTSYSSDEEEALAKYQQDSSSLATTNIHSKARDTDQHRRFVAAEQRRRRRHKERLPHPSLAERAVNAATACSSVLGNIWHRIKTTFVYFCMMCSNNSE